MMKVVFSHSVESVGLVAFLRALQPNLYGWSPSYRTSFGMGVTAPRGLYFTFPFTDLPIKLHHITNP